MRQGLAEESSSAVARFFSESFCRKEPAARETPATTIAPTGCKLLKQQQAKSTNVLGVPVIDNQITSPLMLGYPSTDNDVDDGPWGYAARKSRLGLGEPVQGRGERLRYPEGLRVLTISMLPRFRVVLSAKFPAFRNQLRIQKILFRDAGRTGLLHIKIKFDCRIAEAATFRGLPACCVAHSHLS